jgi:pilus assembly protein CpaF
VELETILQFFPPAVRELILATDVSDVMINPDGRVYTDCRGRLVEHPGVSITPTQLVIGIQNIARILGRDIDETQSILDSRLPNGSRVAAVFSHGEMTVTIRKFNRWYTAEELVKTGTLPVVVRDLLLAAIRQSKNILVSGGTASGKSTLAKALLDHVPSTDRLLLIEKPRELAVSQPNAVRWEARDAAPGRPVVTVAQLLVAALRHRPDRIVIGEVREPESAYELLQAMNTGHAGTLSTIHADSALDALHRLSDLALAAHSNLTTEFVRQQVARTIHYVAHVERDVEGRRRVMECAHVTQGKFQVEPLYLANERKEQACRL